MTVPLSASARGKHKERAPTGQGNGTESGIILSMDMVSTSSYAVAYTVPVLVGSSQQTFSLQVDTGSSDLWIASKSCTSASCSATSGRLYDPSSSRSTGIGLTMQYLSGAVSGPIVWDRVQIGNYTIPNQALAAATSVNDEPLSPNFDGVLGLALPANSVIQQALPASTGDAPDGAAVPSNLFSLTPATDAPSQPFFSLTLGRPGFTNPPSLLGIGQHPPSIVPDPSQIRYATLVSSSVGALYWKTTVRAITVYVNGQAHPVALSSLSGAAPTALLDSGIPSILATPALANGIYGALGIGPAADGNYYVPCATPLNMSVTLDGQDELALHPLDLTAEPAGQSSAQYCTGLVQTDPRLSAGSDVGDMVLGVPFMRNVYTVLAYAQPDGHGNFGPGPGPGAGGGPSRSSSGDGQIQPMLGLMGLTNATQAMVEFEQVRVLKQAVGGSPASVSATATHADRFSVGVKILVGLVGFFGVCLALFAVRCLVARKRLRRARAEEGEEGGAQYAYGTSSSSSADQKTLVSGSPRDDRFDLEFGMRSKPAEVELCDSDPWDPYAGWRDTIVGTEAGEPSPPPSRCVSPPRSPPGSPEQTSALLAAHERTDDDLGEFGMTGGMAGIGTAARGSVLSAEMQVGRSSWDSFAPLRSSRRFASPRGSVSVPFVDRAF